MEKHVRSMWHSTSSILLTSSSFTWCKSYSWPVSFRSLQFCQSESEERWMRTSPYQTASVLMPIVAKCPSKTGTIVLTIRCLTWPQSSQSAWPLLPPFPWFWSLVCSSLSSSSPWTSIRECSWARPTLPLIWNIVTTQWEAVWWSTCSAQWCFTCLWTHWYSHLVPLVCQRATLPLWLPALPS